MMKMMVMIRTETLMMMIIIIRALALQRTCGHHCNYHHTQITKDCPSKNTNGIYMALTIVTVSP